MSKRYHEPPSRTIVEVPRPTVGDLVIIRIIGEQPSHVDLRAFSASRTSKGEPRPTACGLSLRPDVLDAVIRGLLAARETWR